MAIKDQQDESCAAAGDLRPPLRYREFIGRFPELSQAWEAIHAASRKGPLDERSQRLVKLAVAMGAMREGAVRSGTRKALAMGIPFEEIEQLVPLAAGTLGMPSAVACWSWMMEAAKK
jgi:4-carboxymuconolactone decarboxylase